MPSPPDFSQAVSHPSTCNRTFACATWVWRMVWCERAFFCFHIVPISPVFSILFCRANAHKQKRAEDCSAQIRLQKPNSFHFLPNLILLQKLLKYRWKSYLRKFSKKLFSRSVFRRKPSGRNWPADLRRRFQLRLGGVDADHQKFAERRRGLGHPEACRRFPRLRFVSLGVQVGWVVAFAVAAVGLVAHFNFYLWCHNPLSVGPLVNSGGFRPEM